MTKSNVVGPECSKCGKPMPWVAVELVDKKPINVFHCDSCDKFAALAETPIKEVRVA